VTNRHVVEGERRICVRTADGRLRPGVTVLPARAEGLDVAFLWLKGVAALPTARTASAPGRGGTGWSFPVVRASGFPLREEREGQPPAYRELPGLLLPLLPRPLEGGMQLATTAAVRKGMSGGGLFDQQDRLIGINTTHADPLWPAPLKEAGGRPVPDELNRRLELVALAIPVGRILALLDALPQPGPISTTPDAQPLRASATTAAARTHGAERLRDSDQPPECSQAARRTSHSP
jgi:S1-C subfamily serine protease